MPIALCRFPSPPVTSTPQESEGDVDLCEVLNASTRSSKVGLCRAAHRLIAGARANQGRDEKVGAVLSHVEALERKTQRRNRTVAALGRWRWSSQRPRAS